jgi:hypothetical protein
VSRAAPRGSGPLAWSLAGPAIWFVHLSILYAAETLICLSPNPGEGAMFAISTVATVAVIGALLAVGAFQLSRRRIAADRFLAETGLLLTALALVGVLFATVGLMTIDACTEFVRPPA